MNDMMKEFLRLVKRAYYDAKKANEIIFSEKKHINKTIALSFISTAMAKCCAAEALYYSKEELEHYSVPDLLYQFHVFSHEAQINFAEDHSQQWSGIEFDRLEELFENSICSQPIPE